MPRKSRTTSSEPTLPPTGLIIPPDILGDLARKNITTADALVCSLIFSVANSYKPWEGCWGSTSWMGLVLNLSPEKVDTCLRKLDKLDLIRCIDLWRVPASGPGRRAYATLAQAHLWSLRDIPHPIELGGKDV